jgi:hypothetical protein
MGHLGWKVSNYMVSILPQVQTSRHLPHHSKEHHLGQPRIQRNLDPGWEYS